MASIKHKFTSNKADGTDATLIQASNWNDDHDLTVTKASLLGGTAAGAVQEITLGTGLQFDGLTLNATATGSGGGVTSYTQLTDKPTIPTNVSDLINDSGFITVSDIPASFSGSYNDLTDRPTIPDITGLASEAYVTTAISNLVDGADAAFDTLKEIQDAMATDAELSAAIAGLSTSTFSGDYNDLANRPTIPSTIQELGAPGITSGQLLAYDGSGWVGTTVSAPTISNLSTAQTIVDIERFGHTSVPVTSLGSPTHLRIDSDADIYIKATSNTSGLYGALLDAVAVYRTDVGDLEHAGLDFGTENFTIESWVYPTAQHASSGRLMAICTTDNAQNIHPYVDVLDSTGELRVGFEMRYDGATIKMANVVVVEGFVPTGPVHITWVVERSRERVLTYVNGSVVDITAFSDPAPRTRVFGLPTGGGNHRIIIGGTWTANPMFPGEVYDLKAYTTALSATQVQERTKLGPNRADGISGDADLTWWINFVDTGWVNPNKPQTVINYPATSSDFVTSGSGTATVIEASGAERATSLDIRVLARQPETFELGAGTDISILSDSIGTNRIRLMPQSVV